MSELQEHQFCECDEFVREYRGPLSNEMRPYYLKSEADKVIAELKDKLQNVSELLTETREWLIESQKMHKRCADNAIKQLRHHKYKRCLAMAWWCSAELGMLVSTWESKIKYYKRWQKRWLELADKFKEAK